jgi:class 3 adenylate cyclase
MQRLPVETRCRDAHLLFSDIAGSTRLLARLGDRYVEVLAEHQRVLRAVFARFNGPEVSTGGVLGVLVEPDQDCSGLIGGAEARRHSPVLEYAPRMVSICAFWFLPYDPH